jgi:hypothetical protein
LFVNLGGVCFGELHLFAFFGYALDLLFALLNGRAGELNNTLLKGGHRPTRLIGATPEIDRDERSLSTFYARIDEMHDLPS